MLYPVLFQISALDLCSRNGSLYHTPFGVGQRLATPSCEVVGQHHKIKTLHSRRFIMSSIRLNNPDLFQFLNKYCDNIVKVTGHLLWFSVKNRYCALNIKFSSNVHSECRISVISPCYESRNIL